MDRSMSRPQRVLPDRSDQSRLRCDPVNSADVYTQLRFHTGLWRPCDAGRGCLTRAAIVPRHEIVDLTRVLEPWPPGGALGTRLPRVYYASGPDVAESEPRSPVQGPIVAVAPVRKRVAAVPRPT